MKKQLFIFVLLLIIGFILHPVVNAQETYKARLSVDYYKIIGQRSFVNVAVKFKGDDGYEPAVMLPLNLYYEVEEDSLVFVDKVTTDMGGNAQYDIDISALPKADSLIKHKYIFKVENNAKFKETSKSVSFIDTFLKAESVVKDSLNYILAQLLDPLRNPIEGTKLEVKLHRLFAPLTIGESYYKTDDDGTILVLIEEPLPGVNGNLTFEVMLDSKKYGTVSYIFDSPIGKPIVDKSTFDQRTMWSPPTKTPLFLWIFPNLIILGIWAVIFLLLFNLVKIYKS